MKALIQVLSISIISVSSFTGSALAAEKAIAVAACQTQTRMMDAGRYITIVKTKNTFQAHSYQQTIAGPTKPIVINLQQEVETLANQNTLVKFTATQFELAFELVKGDSRNNVTAQLTLDYPEGKFVENMDCQFTGRSR